MYNREDKQLFEFTSIILLPVKLVFLSLYENLPYNNNNNNNNNDSILAELKRN